MMKEKRGTTLKLDKTAKAARQWTVSIARLIFLVAFSYILIYPVIFMFTESIKTAADTMNPAVQWLSRNPTFYPYEMAWKGMEYPHAFLLTVEYEMVSAVLEVISCAVCAYGLARFNFRLKPVLMGLLIVTILIPDIVLVIPRIQNFRDMDILGIFGLIGNAVGTDLTPNLTDTVWTFYLPSICGVGLKGGVLIYIYMQFFKGLPRELEEASWIDGAGPFRTFVQVIIPSSGVVILTVFVFAMVWHWNDWLLATMYTSNNWTLAAEIREISQVIGRWAQAHNVTFDQQLSYGAPLAACLMYIAPPTIVYLFLQRKFIQSIDRVGIVG